ncbi:Swt1 family HEPN domain-containing protein [Methanocalculus sp.]|uniref:Swt1 family HEPN domain-containing protein n=1 Tax=Methanocalculus sp. TaxID=2004547 RepID=UPI0026204F49|nr:Swt1 family HEPN domain-containing protein [Methanocalculus sp.]MDG6249556.1 Swt1 family HEPN domain-containing protein [Methanocalculus sp.]
MVPLKNPFASVGKIVSGDFFIGRKKQFKVIDEKILYPDTPGNLAIIGEPRIGKSSLIYHKIISQKNELIKQNIIPIWIPIGKFNEGSTFFKELGIELYTEIIDNNLEDNKIKKAAELLFSTCITSPDYFYNLQKFFKSVRKSGIKSLFILDEFDYSRKFFKGDVSGFHNVRELCYNPDYGVTFITISRRNLHEIEEKSEIISTLNDVFSKYYLGMYDGDDLEEYYMKFKYAGIEITKSEVDNINKYCGNHPYLLALIGDEIFKNYPDTHRVDLINSISEVQCSFEDYYKSIIHLHQDDATLNKLLQILFGPVIDVTQGDVERLLKQGIITPHPSGLYHGYSEHFQEYLALISREVEFWPIWCQTEKGLREIITTQLENKHGLNWVGILENQKQSLKTMFENCRQRQQKEKANFGIKASDRILDFTYPHDLFEIIFFEWTPIFKDIFYKDKNYWAQKVELLAKIRNPLAHNRFDCVSESEKINAEGYCKEILERIREFKTKNA